MRLTVWIGGEVNSVDRGITTGIEELVEPQRTLGPEPQPHSTWLRPRDRHAGRAAPPRYGLGEDRAGDEVIEYPGVCVVTARQHCSGCDHNSVCAIKMPPAVIIAEWNHIRSSQFK